MRRILFIIGVLFTLVLGLYFSKTVVFLSPWEYQHGQLRYWCDGGCGDSRSYDEYSCHCCPDDPPPGCEGGGGSCPTGENLSCEANLADAACASSGGKCKVYSKGLSANGVSSALIDSVLTDDSLALIAYGDGAGLTNVTHSNEFLVFADSLYDDYCTTQHRNYAYIYIPTGWWSFGLKADQSTMLDPSDPACGYCDNQTPTKYYEIPGKSCCGGTIYSWIGVASGQGTSSANPYVAPTPTKTTLADNFAAYSNWKSLTSFDYNNIALLPKAPAETRSLDAGLGVAYTYNWISDRIKDDDDNNKLNDGEAGDWDFIELLAGDPYKIFRVSFSGSKQINGVYISAIENDSITSPVRQPRSIEFYCNGTTLLSTVGLRSDEGKDHTYWTLDGNCSWMDVKVYQLNNWAVQMKEVTFFGENGAGGSGGSTIALWTYGSANINNSPYNDQGGYPAMQLYVKDLLVKTFYVGKRPVGTPAPYYYTHPSVVKPEEVRVAFVNNSHGSHPVNSDPSKVLTIDKMVLDGITYQTEGNSTYVTNLGGPDDCSGNVVGYGQTDHLACNGYFWYNLLGNRGDTVWGEAKYYQAGWYPVELSADWGKKFLFNPQLWWKNGSTGTIARYSDGVYNGTAEAKISSCSPGEVNCSCTVGSIGPYLAGETHTNVNIGTILHYNTGDFDVYSPDSRVAVSNEHVTGSTVYVDLAIGEDFDTSTNITLYITASSETSGGDACTNSTCPITFTVSPSSDFWRVKDMDVTTIGNLESILRGGYFDEEGDGGYPGIPVFGGDYTFGDGATSEEKDWLVNTTVSSTSYLGYSYAFFEKQAPEGMSSLGDDTVSNYAGLVDGATAEGGYSWIKYGSLTFKDSDIVIPTGSKAVVFVDGALTIEKNITLQSHGTTFLMFVVSGDITIGQDVANLEGIFFTDGDFSTGAGDDTLNVRGSVVAKGRVYLDRDLPTGSTDPSEYFTYASDLFLSVPYDFGARVMSWREVSPTSPE